MSDESEVVTPSLPELASVFARYANTTFGGGSATIAVLKQQIVQKRSWLRAPEFDLNYALSRLTPGTNLLAFCTAAGWTRRRWLGAIVALIASSIPCSLLAVLITIFYTNSLHAGNGAWFQAALSGALAAAVAIMVSTAWVFAEPHVKAVPWKAAIVVPATAALALGLHLSPVKILLLAAVAGVLWPVPRPKGVTNDLAVGGVVTKLVLLLWILIKSTCTSFAGLASLPEIRQELVDERHWATDEQIDQSIVITRTTPGPVGVWVVSVCYMVDGWPGAIAGWIAMAAPSMVVIILVGYFGRRAQQHARVRSLLQCVVLASATLLVLAAIPIGRDALNGPLTIGITVVALPLLSREEGTTTRALDRRGCGRVELYRIDDGCRAASHAATRDRTARRALSVLAVLGATVEA